MIEHLHPAAQVAFLLAPFVTLIVVALIVVFERNMKRYSLTP